MNSHNFKIHVDFAISEGYEKQVAAEFEVASSTVRRWANGVAKPHPKMQEKIVNFISRLVFEGLKNDKEKS